MTEQADIRILVADDDKNIAQLIAMECGLEGFAVDVVKDGQQAILKLRESAYSLAILDWNMPLMSGYDVCRRLRETGSGLPILMLPPFVHAQLSNPKKSSQASKTSSDAPCAKATGQASPDPSHVRRLRAKAQQG